MGDVAILSAVVIASAVASAGAAVYSGYQQQAAASAQRSQYEEERRASALQAEIDQSNRMRTLRNSLSTQDALRASRGLDLGSQTGDAIRDADMELAARDLAVIGMNADRAGRRLGLAGDMARAQGETALYTGYASGFSSLAGGAARAYGISNPRPVSNPPGGGGLRLMENAGIHDS